MTQCAIVCERIKFTSIDSCYCHASCVHNTYRVIYSFNVVVSCSRLRVISAQLFWAAVYRDYTLLPLFKKYVINYN